MSALPDTRYHVQTEGRGHGQRVWVATSGATPAILENKTMYTRKEYLNDSRTDGGAAYRRYYGQFVTPATISAVVHQIGADRIKNSTDPCMNDIPLELWDALVPRLPGSGGFKRAGDYYTLANGVCLAKEAARQWLEAQD